MPPLRGFELIRSRVQLAHYGLGEFQGYEFGWLGAGVGQGVGVVAREPFGVAGFEVAEIGRVDVVEVRLSQI